MIPCRVNMFVEDKVSAQGPIAMMINPDVTVAGLKLQVEKELDIPSVVQNWILGKNLVTEDNVSLRSQGVEHSGSTIFLYLVAPGE